ncbi:Holliday junction resolvase RecU [Virgibacillus alimentarius]|uniref:Holliday junction resolvase RecU n=1 Tax=Virgibacillus alimentarius TaxID=698769 RepID=A0ABS4S4D7_9BACI|nr:MULTISPECIES: Holliday junction resolvase RecU [Virgibacillus]MBP2256348.1 recombination protein U [Virgibacillus alimentarius]HLR66293.1 Holliday junction resolvase RecU [Virgibacillus sp.]
MNYPNGKKAVLHQEAKGQGKQNYSNRGMTLEEDINHTNAYYLTSDKAIIHKKPTPVQIVNVHYPKRSAAVITEGYFKQASTTDYNGIYRNRYIDFEAKETRNKTLFPLSNIHEHQIEHMESIVNHGGICFLIVRFTAFNETYYIKAETLLSYWKDKLNGGRKSIPYSAIKQEGYQIPFQYQARVDYLKVIDKLYF